MVGMGTPGFCVSALAPAHYRLPHRLPGVAEPAPRTPVGGVASSILVCMCSWEPGLGAQLPMPRGASGIRVHPWHLAFSLELSGDSHGVTVLGYPQAGAAVTPRRWPWAGRVRAWLQSLRCVPQGRGVAPPGAWACIPRLPTGLMLSLAHLSTWFLGSEKEASGTGFDLGLYLFLVAQRVKSLPVVRETDFRSLGWEDPLEEGMATHSSILAWRISWTEEPGGLQSVGWQRVRHD